MSGVTVSIQPWWLVAPAVAVPPFVLAALRWVVLERRAPSEQRDLRLAQNAIAVAALALAIVPATLAWPLAARGGGLTASR